MSVNKIKFPDSTTANINDSRIHIYRTLTGTAAVTTSPYYCSRWNVSDSTISAYEDGMVVCIKVPVVGNDTYGVGLQINSLGYKPVVFNVNSNVTTRYGVGAVVWAVYNSTQTASLYVNSSSALTITGCWQVMDYDQGLIAITTGEIDGLWNPLITGSGTLEDPYVGWNEKVAAVVNPNKLNYSDSTLSATIPGIYNEIYEKCCDDVTHYFEGGLTEGFLYSGSYIAWTFYGNPTVNVANYFFNSNFSGSGRPDYINPGIYIYPNDTVTFNMVED